jgi:hypothetical protein
MNTGDINSDRSTWLFLSLVYVVRGYGNQTAHDSLAMLTRDAPREVAA